MVWKFTDDRPVYQQIMTLMRGAVLRGEYRPGDRIPSVRDLATAARVNPNTMQRGLSELEREGVLVSCGTMGREITKDEEVLRVMKETIQRELARDCAERFRNMGIDLKKAAALLLQMAEEEK